MTDHIIRDIAALEALYGEVNEVSALKEISYLHPHYAAFVKASPFAVLATAGPHGLDASPRGDAAGFVEIVDDKTPSASCRAARCPPPARGSPP